MTEADRLIAVAEKEVGYVEKSRSAYDRYGKDILYFPQLYAGSDNYTKYNYEMHQISPDVMDFPAAWCDAFVDWCFLTAFGRRAAEHALHGRFDDYTQNSASLYIRDGAMSTTPERGRQVFFTKNQTFAGIHHTGIVTAVDETYIYTI